jgi:hypothetical protein
MVNKDYNSKKQNEKNISRRPNVQKEYSYAPRTTAPTNCEVCDGYDQSCSKYIAQSPIYVTTCKTKYSFGHQMGELERKLNAVD